MSMTAAAHAREAVTSIFSTLQRSLLALAGIVVGIASVIALLTIGGMVRQEAIKQFEALGTDMLTVLDTASHSGEELGLRTILDTTDADQLVELPSLVGASPYMLGSGRLALGGRQRQYFDRIGVTARFADMHRVRLAEGRFISPFDGRQGFAVIGAEVAEAMRESGLRPELGMQLRMGDRVYVLVGVLRGGAQGPPGARLDGSVLIPIKLAEREEGTKRVYGIVVRTAPDVHYQAATAEIKAHFVRTAPELSLRVDSPVWLIEQMEEQMRMFTLLLGTVGGISLVVGGIGIMNTMLASVVERRLEVGIRRALGARRRDIQGQFLAESSMLCLAGGVLGALLGVGATVVISMLTEWTWLFSASSVAIGVGTACAVGLFFGFYPARQAARLNPITALRDS